jgi:NAD(P)-dependent dehydrogenase (short-subunit alcohol dehydrogenase family)
MKKTVVVTGATGAIGKATALELAKNDTHIILIGRNSGKLLKVRSEIELATNNKNIEIVAADLSEPASVKKAAEDIKSKHKAIHALVNIAAAFIKDRKENSKGQEFMFATNHLGTFVLTNELLPLLKAGKPARVITVSAPSTTKVNFDDIHGKQKWSPGFMGAFGASKMMNLMHTYALARRLEGSGVSTSVFHPGLVKSELTSAMPAFLNWFFQSISSPPDKAARQLTKLVLDPAYANSNGTFVKFDGKEIKSNAYSYDKDNQEKLWKLSEEMTA